MELNVYDDKKYISIWLTKAEAADAGFQENLKPIYEKYRQKKYRVVVFESGTGDLVTLTKDLLKHSLETTARREKEADCR